MQVICHKFTLHYVLEFTDSIQQKYNTELLYVGVCRHNLNEHQSFA